MGTLRLTTILLAVTWIGGCNSPDAPQNSTSSINPMNNQHLEALIKKIDDKVQGKAGYWSLRFEGHQAQVITDGGADRMRVIAPVTSADALDKKTLYRLMQANFGTAIDARYCVARGTLWAAYIHPLSLLTDDQFLAGLKQAISLVETYGTTYSGGSLRFQADDSEQKDNEKKIKTHSETI